MIKQINSFIKSRIQDLFLTPGIPTAIQKQFNVVNCLITKINPNQWSTSTTHVMTFVHFRVSSGMLVIKYFLSKLIIVFFIILCLADRTANLPVYVDIHRINVLSQVLIKFGNHLTFMKNNKRFHFKCSFRN